MRAEHGNGAFSLTELLVVVAVILILVSILFVVTERVYSRGTQLECQHRLEQIGQAFQMYSNRHHGMMPRSWDMYARRRWYETLEATCLDNAAVLGCPSAGTPPVQTGGGGGGAPPELSEPILKALRWLKGVQESDGRWDVSNYSGSRGSSDCGVTGLAIMAYLGYGCTDKYPEEFADTVSKGINWLVGRQQASGRFPGNRTFGYEHSICVMALSQVYAMTGDPNAKHAAEKGLNWLLPQQDKPVSEGGMGHCGFGYDSDKDDISVTGWALQAIWASDMAGLDVSKTTRDRVEILLEKMVYTDGTYRTFYRYRPGHLAERTASREAAAGAISLTCRLLMDHKLGSSASYTSSAGRCRGVLNYLRGNNRHFTYGRANSNLLYFYYYMTLANSLLGGQYWQEWSTGASPVFPDELTQHQSADGSWPRSICTWGNYGGTVYTTALAAMTLEAGFADHWLMVPTEGQLSYGYNGNLGLHRCSLSADTIVVADAQHWIIDRDDDPCYLAPRHGGRMNILFGDGSVRPLALDEITDRMWTPPQPPDE